MSNNKVQLPVTINGKQLHVGDSVMTRWGVKTAFGFNGYCLIFTDGLRCQLCEGKYIIDDDTITETKAECTIEEEPTKDWYLQIIKMILKMKLKNSLSKI